ncbi:Os05g0501325 [Oryza sativa Japonica Group]|uniref:Os05g0501325 protein n=1 Tax=Oryza sativa subsp. japonica TaxID=39947 RepID=A0A0P0WP41_ORYSJ|nr:hypothetical protein EE612_030449 [Oryza sativa]BAS94767.1 Os05g0501325 [Oryza sativa Japonica Group]
MPWCASCVTAVSGVVSWPPPWVPVLKKTPAGLPARLCSRHRPPVASKNAFICAAIMPNLVGNPNRTPSASASSCGAITGASLLGGAPILPSTSSERLKLTCHILTSTPSTDEAPFLISSASLAT